MKRIGLLIRWLVMVLVLVGGVAACASAHATGNSAQSASGEIHLKITYYPGGLGVVYRAGEADGAIGGHQILVPSGGAYSGFKFNSCRLSGREVIATGQLTNTLDQMADFSFTADVYVANSDGLSPVPIGTVAFQVLEVPPGGKIRMLARMIAGRVIGRGVGCPYYTFVAAASASSWPGGKTQ